MSKYKFDVNKLLNPTTPIAAYWLGLFWADGTFQSKNSKYKSISITCVSEDMDLIVNSLKIFGSFGYYVRKGKNNRKDQSTIFIHGKELSEGLDVKGYKNKGYSSACLALSNIPIELQKYWLRGFFDGDGCFYLKQHQSKTRTLNKVKNAFITSRYEQDWKFMEDISKKQNWKYRIQKIKKENSSSSRFIISTNKSIIDFGNFIYEDHLEIGFKRKYITYLEIVDDIKKNINKKNTERLMQGVSFEQRTQKWVGRFRKNKKWYFVGRFDLQHEALLAVQSIKQSIVFD